MTEYFTTMDSPIGELLLTRDHVQRRARNTGKPQPVAPFDDFERLHHSVANPYV